jgi:glutamate carboxypeptidase
MNNLRAIFTREYPNFLRDLEALVNVDCGTYNKAGVDRVVAYVKNLAEGLGASVAEFPQTTYGDCLYLKMRGTGRARVFMIGHTDTVYPDGTVGQYPFRRANGRLLGPGANDMKAGLLAGLYAMKILREAGFGDFAELGLFVNSEEEIGSPVSRMIYPALARGADAALVLESARSNGNIVSARKGSGMYTLRGHGKSAHAGVDPQKGANAILALANCVIEISRLNKMNDGLTVNVGVISGGMRPNVVPDSAEAQVDLRVIRSEDAQEFEERLREIVTREFVHGVRVEVSGGLSSPPMPKTAAGARLVEFAKEAAAENGFKMEDVFTGGASDGNMLAGEGVPVLDGLGPIGGHDHNAPEEYVVEDSIIPRVTMLARIIQLIAEHDGELERKERG